MGFGLFRLQLVILLLSVYAYVVTGRTKFGKCWAYDVGEEIRPTDENYGRKCQIGTTFYERLNGRYTMRDDPRIFCYEFLCQVSNCVPLIRGPDGCQRCEDETDCQWLGRIVKNGTWGLCPDGCNRCRCHNGKIQRTTLKACPLGFCY